MRFRESHPQAHEACRAAGGFGEVLHGDRARGIRGSGAGPDGRHARGGFSGLHGVGEGGIRDALEAQAKATCGKLGLRKGQRQGGLAGSDAQGILHQVRDAIAIGIGQRSGGGRLGVRAEALLAPDLKGRLGTC